MYTQEQIFENVKNMWVQYATNFNKVVDIIREVFKIPQEHIPYSLLLIVCPEIDKKRSELNLIMKMINVSEEDFSGLPYPKHIGLEFIEAYKYDPTHVLFCLSLTDPGSPNFYELLDLKNKFEKLEKIRFSFS